MSKAVNIIFPHQLFADSPLLTNGHEIYLIEEHLFFKQYQFHKQKMAFHRASMKRYQQYLKEKEISVNYIETHNELSDIRNFEKEIIAKGITEIHAVDPTDYWLELRLKKTTKNCNLKLYENQLFTNSKQDLSAFFKTEKKVFLQTSFYIQQRKKHHILMESDDKPIGGQWSYDAENRKKYPKDKKPPRVDFMKKSIDWDEAVSYVKKHFPHNPGELTNERIYPIDFEESNAWFDQFLSNRFLEFGDFEDAIVANENFLHHSILSPLLNIGLLDPAFVIKESLSFAQKERIPINSTEGFVRQILGWREFIRGMYECKGNVMRTKNFWNFDRPIPNSFYDGSTGIPPIDATIKQILKTGYCHHIERLMILGNFMLLCEFDPDAVYQWFMELFIDAYDWVMVPNVYGMSQFADGGIFATKPYIGGSNYVLKMSNYPKGDWTKVWDGLYWSFIGRHQDFFKSNPRTSMFSHLYHKMSSEKREMHFQSAQDFLQKM